MAEKTFWRRPEGVTGGIVLAGIVLAGGVALSQMLPVLVQLAENTLYLSVMMASLAAIIYVALDPKARNLVWYGYKSVMRWITGLFVRIDPISVLKSYIEDLQDNLRNLSKQIGALRGQMRQLKGIMDGNTAEIRRNMTLAEQARQKNDDKNLTLATRKAGRLQDANTKYEALFQKMDVLYRVLTRMYENSEIVLDDTRDQVKVKEQEFLAIQSSHSAIRSAKNVLSGDPDRKALFNQALETLADEVGARVGEMDRFMDTSKNLLASIDLQNGVFEEEGLKLLENWDKSSPLLAEKPPAAEKNLDLNQPPKQAVREENHYDRLFD